MPEKWKYLGRSLTLREKMKVCLMGFYGMPTTTKDMFIIMVGKKVYSECFYRLEHVEVPHRFKNNKKTNF